jgi:hypothetical protein
MIARIWRGWTAHQNADAFEAVLRTESLPNALGKNISGLREIQVLRLQRLGETEFITILWFDDMDAVRALAMARGAAEEDYEKSIVSQRARELLRRYDLKVEHYEVNETMRTSRPCSKPAAVTLQIARVWRGWTTHQNADAYETILRTETFPSALAKNIGGLRELQALRLERLGETEFLAIMWFDDMDAVHAFAVARDLATDEYEKSVISQKAREVLRRYDFKVEHYEVKEIARP